jgi:hypothetical protein
MDFAGVELDIWRRGHFVGRFKVPPSRLSPPDGRFASRIVDKEHVKDLKNSFCKLATVNEELLGVVVSDTMFARMSRAGMLGLTFRGGISTMNVDDFLRDTEVVIHTCSGDHSRVALCELVVQFPRNVKFQLAYVELLVVPNDDVTERFLTLLGNLENMKPRNKPNFKQWIAGMHRRAMLNRNEEGGWDTNYITNIKNDMMYTSGLASGIIGHFWQMAKRDGEYWEALEKLLEGKFEKTTVKGSRINNKQLSSPANLTKLGGGLPDNVAIKLLNEVRTNKITWATMNMKIVAWKMKTRLMVEGAEHLAGLARVVPPDNLISSNKRHSARKKERGWLQVWLSQVTSASPSLDDTWLTEWAERLRNLKQKDPLPETWKSQLLAIWEKDHRKGKRAKASKIVDGVTYPVLYTVVWVCVWFTSARPLSLRGSTSSSWRTTASPAPCGCCRAEWRTWPRWVLRDSPTVDILHMPQSQLIHL